MAPRNGSKKPKLISKAEYAAKIGVNRSQITRYVAKGMPSHGGMIDPDEADWWRQQNLDPTKPKSKVTDRQVGKAKAASAETPDPPKQPVPPPKQSSGPPPGNEEPGWSPDGFQTSGVIVHFPDGSKMDLLQIADLTTATRIDKFWAGELKRREVMLHDKEHYPRADVDAATNAAVLMFKNGLLGLGRRLAGRLEGKNLAERELIIRETLRRALEKLAEKLSAAVAGDIQEAGEEPSPDDDSDQPEGD